jgi:1-phosphatidylinositol-4-phosphate 5-kinase
MNPIHSLSLHSSGGAIHTQEVHIVQVTGEGVHLEAANISDTFVNTLGKSLTQVVPNSLAEGVPENRNNHAGPPPPSPPASVDRIEKENKFAFNDAPPRLISSKSDDGYRLPAVSEQEYSAGLSESSISSKANENARLPSLYTNLSPVASGSAVGASINSDDSAPLASLNEAHASGSRTKAGPLSADGHLLPPQPFIRPIRRYTTGSSPKVPPAMHRHGYGGSQPNHYEETDGEGELANDIQLHAEQIRRERMSKRAKAQQEAEAALTRQTSGGKEEGQNVLVGNLIGEDHVNYVLMYNMLTGIRIGVSPYHSIWGMWLNHRHPVFSMPGQNKTSIDRRGL